MFLLLVIVVGGVEGEVECGVVVKFVVEVGFGGGLCLL